MTSPEPTTLAPAQAHGQSLAHGAAGIALPHIERALAGHGSWADAHALIRKAATGPVDASDHAGLYYGAPAIAFMLHTAGAPGRMRYRRALSILDRHVVRLACRRLSAAGHRIEKGAHPHFNEYDLFYGLVGIGSVLRLRVPGSDTFAEVLRYLVRLVLQPSSRHGTPVPGWWASNDPDPTLPTPGGHANLGMAHGAAGILAFLALAVGDGCAVDGQLEAIDQLAGWFEDWRQDSTDGPWWPQWITLEELRQGRTNQLGPGRPSWCYGSTGILRALQLAALATGDVRKQRAAERSLTETLTARNIARISEAGLCHGAAGLYQTVYRAAHDSADPLLKRRLPTLADALTCSGEPGEEGLLNGHAGVDLASETMRRGAPPRSGWDRCLLIT
ncbi:lanthionine synthetase C family protein [Actinomadura nitritigenes]|uniref:lanthionine synthetase C family protein n=1 Tax=Actinomadura nitritigenes TaxID=134602 RepID=UPI0036740A4F